MNPTLRWRFASIVRGWVRYAIIIVRIMKGITCNAGLFIIFTTHPQPCPTLFNRARSGSKVTVWLVLSRVQNAPKTYENLSFY